MIIHSTHPLAPNVLCICIDDIVNGNAKGKFYHCYLKQPENFQDICTVLIKMEDIFDKINLPQASTRARTFLDNENLPLRKELEKHMTPKEVTDNKGSKATFVVHVKYRQNSSWQGSVVWADKNITKNFRSTLELLKLIDGALDECDIAQE